MAVSEPGPGRLHCLLIGVDAYTNGVPPLSGCVNDVDAFQRLLVDRLGVPREGIRRLASPHADAAHESDVPSAPATRKQILDAFAALAGEGVRPEDGVFVYYSGHGTDVPVAEGGAKVMREALVPADAAVADGAATGLLFDVELNALLQRVARRTSRLTLVLDCCHSGGATRDALSAPGDRARAVRVSRAVAGPSLPDDGGAGAAGPAAGAFADWQLVSACLADEKALECDDDAGRKHGLLTQTLLKALAAVPDAELREVPWGRVWRGLVSAVEARRSQHPTLRGSFARPVFGGAPRAGDAGLGVTRAAAGYALDAGELFGVTAGAAVAVYGTAPATFPPLGSPEDLAARVGLLRVTEAKRASASASAEGEAFELPAGARGRVVEAGEAARVAVSVTPRDGAVEAQVAASKLLRLAREGEAAAVQVVGLAGGGWALTDALHGAEEPHLVRVDAAQAGRLGALLEHYARYAAPIRLSEACTDLPGALRVRLLDCDGRLDDGGVFTGDAQRPELPELPRGGDGAYELTEENVFCLEVANTSSMRLKVAFFDCGSEGQAALFGEVVLAPGAAHVFWLEEAAGQPFGMTVPDDRTVLLDRLVAIGTSAVGRSFAALAVPETFADVLQTRAPGAPRGYPPPERWTAARALARTRKAS